MNTIQKTLLFLSFCNNILLADNSSIPQTEKLASKIQEMTDQLNKVIDNQVNPAIDECNKQIAKINAMSQELAIAFLKKMLQESNLTDEEKEQLSQKIDHLEKTKISSIPISSIPMITPEMKEITKIVWDKDLK